MSEPIITARDIRHTYPSATTAPAEVLKGVTMNVGAGEMVSVVGPSGSGKTTLLSCLSGLERPSSGVVEVDGVNLAALRPHPLAKFRRGRIGFVFQQYNLLGSLTARENIAVAARLAGRAADRRAVDKRLDDVGLSGLGERRPSELSGGQQQRVAFARVLATEPRVVFADEPTGALDSAASAVVLHLLRRFADSGGSVVMVTHDLDAAASADRVLVLRDGRLQRELQQPSAAEVFDAVEAAGAQR